MTKPDFDLFGEIEKEAEKPHISHAQIEAISALGKKQRDLESKNFTEEQVNEQYQILKHLSIPFIEEILKKCKVDLNRITQDLLPEAMDSVGMTSFELEDGAKIEITKGISVNLKNENKPAFYSWMIRKGYQSLIKNKVEVQFPKEGRKSSMRFTKYLKRYYADKGACHFIEKEDVHSGTLKKFMKELMEEGKKYPENLIQIHEYKVTKLK